MIGFFVLLFLAIFGVFLLFFIITDFIGAPFAPSSLRTIRSMVRLAKLKPGMVVYDLGSGDGRLLFLAAKKGVTAVGFEINPLLVLITLNRVFFSHLRIMEVSHTSTEVSHTSGVRVRWQNFWKADISDADVVFVYLLPSHVRTLEDLFRRKLKTGTRIVTHSLILPSFPLIAKDERSHVFVYRTPLL